MTDPVDARVERSALLTTAAAKFAGRDIDGAVALAEAELAAGADPTEPLCVLAAAAVQTGALGHALQFLKEVYERPNPPNDVAELLGILYCMAGNLPTGLYYGKEATIAPADKTILPLFVGLPSYPEALASVSHKPLMRRGVEALEAGNVGRALFLLEQHLIVDPRDVEAIDHYTRALMVDGQTEKALGMLRTLVTLAGSKPTLMSRLGTCLVAKGQLDEGLACHRAAIALAPGSAVLWGEMVADLGYLPRGRSDAADAVAKWSEVVAASSAKTTRAAPRLNGLDHVTIGYLCAAGHEEATLAMISRIAGAHDRKRFTVVGFGAGELADKSNVWMRGVFDRWRNVSALDVLTLGALVRGEGVGVLLDADGLRAPARAGLFLRNVAPLQVSWLNGPAVGTMPGAHAVLVGGESPLAYALRLSTGRYLLGGGCSDAGPPPAAGDAPLTLGADVALAELNPDTVRVWAQILHAVPGAMLALRDRGQFATQASIERITELFGNFGVAHRIDVIHGDHAAFIHHVDLMVAPTPAFDPLALGDALRSGVPAVVLAGSAPGDDIAAALAGVGLAAGLVAVDEGHYVAQAIALAQDRDRLADFRARAPGELANAPAFSAKSFAEALEQALLARLEAMLVRASVPA